MRVRWNSGHFMDTLCPPKDALVHDAILGPTPSEGRQQIAALRCYDFPAAIGVIYIPTRSQVNCMVCIAEGG